MRPVCVLVFLGGCSQILGITDPVAATDGGVGGADSGTGSMPGSGGSTGARCVPPPKFPATPTSYALPGGAPGMIALGDFDHDGQLDVAVAVTSEVVILHGDGTGGLARQQIVDLPATAALGGDIDGDGRDDLVLWTAGVSQSVEFLRQDPAHAGSFLAAQPFNRTFSHARQVANSFLDATSLPSPIVQDDAGLWVFVDGPNNTPELLGQAGDQLIAISDISTAGFDEVAVMSPSLGGVAIAAQSGPHFAAPKLIVPAAPTDAAAFGQLTIAANDLAPALLVATPTGGLIYQQNVSDQIFSFAGGVPGVTGGPIQVFDVDHDGRDDIVTAAGILQQCDGGAFSALVPLTTSATTLFRDLDHDNKPELLRTNGQALEVFVQ